MQFKMHFPYPVSYRKTKIDMQFWYVKKWVKYRMYVEETPTFSTLRIFIFLRSYETSVFRKNTLRRYVKKSKIIFHYWNYQLVVRIISIVVILFDLRQRDFICEHWTEHGFIRFSISFYREISFFRGIINFHRHFLLEDWLDASVTKFYFITTK